MEHLNPPSNSMHVFVCMFECAHKVMVGHVPHNTDKKVMHILVVLLRVKERWQTSAVGDKRQLLYGNAVWIL